MEANSVVTTEKEATPDEKEATQELTEAIEEEVKKAAEETGGEKHVDSEKEKMTTVQIPGSASVIVTSEGSASKEPKTDDHEERSVDPPPPG